MRFSVIYLQFSSPNDDCLVIEFRILSMLVLFSDSFINSCQLFGNSIGEVSIKLYSSFLLFYMLSYIYILYYLLQFLPLEDLLRHILIKLKDKSLPTR